MTPEFLRAVVDTVLPGEALPNAAAAGVDLAKYAETARPALDAIAAASGGAARFAAASETERVAMLRRVEREQPAAFRALIMPLLIDYYDAAAVLAALGWRGQPPQPQGHAVPSADEETLRRLERVRARQPLWRT